MYMPKYYTMVSGEGKAPYALLAFDNVLRDAGIGDYNLVKVSSILPPNCEYQNCITIPKGSAVLAAYATITVADGDIGKTGVAIGIPSSIQDNGVIFEYSTNNKNENAGSIAEKMCIDALENRGKTIGSTMKSNKTIKGEKGAFSAAISAVVMW